MRRPRLRHGLLALAMVGLALNALLLPPHGVAQVGPPADGTDGGPKPDSSQHFTFPEDRDSKQRLRAVTDYLDKKSVPWDVVCGTAQQLLDAKSDSFYPVDPPAGGKAGGGRVSVKAKINDLIGHFPKDGRQFYELTYGPAADTLLKEAVANGFDRGRLADASQRYFHTRAGVQATLLLAGLDLEAGNYAEAAYGFQRLLARPDGDDVLGPRTLFKAVVAFKRSGDPRQGEAVARLWDRLEKTFPRDGLAIGRKAYTLADLRTELDRAADPTLDPAADGLIAMRYGNPSHTGVGAGGTPFLDPSFSVPLLYRNDGDYRTGAEWVAQNLEAALKQLNPAKGQVPLPGFFPVTAPNVILYRTYDGLYAVAARDGAVVHGRTLRAGEVLWSSPARAAVQSLLSMDTDLQLAQLTQGWWQNYWQRAMPGVLFENALAGSLSHDGKLAYFVDDLTLPPPPQLFNANMGGFPQPAPAGAPAGTSRLTESNRLVAVNIETGKVEWSLGGPPTAALTEQEEEKSTNTAQLTENGYFLGPPLPANGKLYFLYERNAQLRLACVDPARVQKVPVPNNPNKRQEEFPELVWSQNLGAPNTKLGQDSLRRMQPAFLAYADGVMVCPTNSGSVVAVDVNARSLLWARYYGTAAEPERADPRVGRFGRGGIVVPNGGVPQTLPQDRWRASAPIISAGKVVLTAHDSDQILCLDLRTGDVLWSDPRQKDDLYLGGVIDGKVLVVGKEAVRAYALAGGENRKPAVAWQNLRIGTPSGHGAASKDNVYFLPLVGNPDQKDSKEPQVWAIDVAAGRVRSKTAFRHKKDPTHPNRDPRLELGNLVFHEGQMFAQSAEALTAFPLIELKKQEMDRLLAKNPQDPKGLTDRGELLLDNGKVREAVADFKEAEKHSPPEDVRRTIRQKLYVAYTELLRDDFAAGESFLGEYEALCEVPVETDDPAKKQHLMDEQVRRKGLYLSLVAKGREKQGRLAEAFDAYRSFAALGENRQLVPIYDEPNGMTRPDVWARGRIDAMIRAAKDPAARKPLEDRVRADWEAVRTANDLARLREFVKVFGPYFPAGREAQLLLAEKLLQTNNEDDLRDAQTQLMQLWATADDASTAAKAIDALARVITRRGMLEDAVGLYAQLGTRYADVVIRDGKTGADVYGELITDKRLLPYLEPGRGPTSSRYRVEPQTSPATKQAVQAFGLVPEGDLFPFFRRFTLAMQMSPNDGTWALAVADRATGEERCRFTGLAPLQSVVGGVNPGPPAYRIAQANGHLLLLTIGQFAYCFDLAEKRELWRYNLIGAAPHPANTPPRVEQTPDGDVVFSYEDGWSLRLGRSSVLQPTYACLVTRDGLVAVDPATGQKLWVRSNVSPKVQVFGDAKHVFLVEGGSSRVLRAVDGTAVEGVKDFAGLMNGSARVAVLGRQLLLNEAAGDTRTLRLYDPLTGADVWKREFPAKAVLLKTLDPELTGCLTPTGAVEVVAMRTGKDVFRGALDADQAAAHMKGVTGATPNSTPVLLADAERVYLFLNRPPEPGRSQPVYGYSMVRSIDVNGVAYGFDRATGKRLWFTERLFEAQKLLLERFDELPALVAAAQVMNDQTKAFEYQVVVFDKQQGRVRYLRGHPANGFFVTVTSDPRTRAVEFWRFDVRVRIVPEEEQRAGQ